MSHSHADASSRMDSRVGGPGAGLAEAGRRGPGGAGEAPLPAAWTPTRYELPSKPTGEHFAFVASARTSSDRCFRFVWTLAAGKTGPGEHLHEEEEEVFEIVSGTLRIWMNGVPGDYGPGQRCVVRRGTRHRFLNPGTVPAVVNVRLDGPRMEDALVPVAVATHGRALRAGDLARMFAGFTRPYASTPVGTVAPAVMSGLVALLRLVGVRPFPPVHGWDAPDLVVRG